MLKHRLKTIERKVLSKPKATTWIVRSSALDIDETDVKIRKVITGQVKNADGLLYQQGDALYIISPAYLPNLRAKKKPVRKKSKISLTTIQRIEVLKKRKQDLERKLREKLSKGKESVGTSIGSAVLARSE